MPLPEIVRRLRRRIAAPRELVWAIASDTNRWDRVVGASPSTYDTDARRERIGHGKIAGMDASWIERGEWIEGTRFHGTRHYTSGVLARADFAVTLENVDGAVEIEATSTVVPRAAIPPKLADAMSAGMDKSLAKYLEAIDRALAPVAAREHGTDAEPAVSRARRALLDVPPDGVITGRKQAGSADHLAYCAERFASAPVDAPVRARILAHLADRPDDDVRQMRPFELARAWGLAPRVVLAAFLHAARAGLVDLRWQLNCPVCRVASQQAASLADVRGDGHCNDCQLDYALDFAANVEAVFEVNAAIRPVESAVYCAGSPWFRPHVFARVELAPHTHRELELPLPAAPLFVRAMRADRREVAALGDTPRAIEISDGALAVNAGASRGPIRVDNHTDGEVTLHVERSALAADMVLGTEIVTMPDFLDLFATEAPATGADLSVGALTVLFSDLTGITALYEQLGDARAFALVETHFRGMAAVIARHDGAIVKTMGDAIMASFRSPAAAVAAALDMIAETRRVHGPTGPRLRVGVHHGPCLAVRANGRLDFFGSSVNMAARLQGQAHGGQLVILADLLDHPEVHAVVAARGLTAARSHVALKGLRESRTIVALNASE